ncbi:hypothetical protein N5P37_011148 [Trichoderma harzianum]|nr:hypothetical protein N5P37_011148 [Trichoderma harzianum]
MTTSTAKDGCALQACSNCRVRKKKCDKVFPSCTTCRKKFINCNYEENRSQHEIRTLRSQLESLSNGLTVAGGPSLIPLSLDSTTQHYPIPSQWYMPFLVNHSKSMNSHLDEARIHKQGLLQMINANGGLRKLGFDGFLSHMITL